MYIVFDTSNGIEIQFAIIIRELRNFPLEKYTRSKEALNIA